MLTFNPTIVVRHCKENVKKCSLRGLEQREDFIFFSYPKCSIPTLDNYLILALDAPPLSIEDKGYGLFVIDATWRYAVQMEQKLGQQFKIRRSIPSGFRTVYPRRQTDCPNPEQGLASIEAIYAAYSILGRDLDGLLENYYWHQQFLDTNFHLL